MENIVVTDKSNKTMTQEITDSLQNLVAGLNTSRDKSFYTTFHYLSVLMIFIIVWNATLGLACWFIDPVI